MSRDISMQRSCDRQKEKKKTNRKKRSVAIGFIMRTIVLSRARHEFFFCHVLSG